MGSEARDALRAGQIKFKKAAKSLKQKVEPSWMERQLVKLYLKSPSKVQFALAKYGVKHVVKKKKADLEEMLKH